MRITSTCRRLSTRKRSPDVTQPRQKGKAPSGQRLPPEDGAPRSQAELESAVEDQSPVAYGRTCSRYRCKLVFPAGMSGYSISKTTGGGKVPSECTLIVCSGVSPAALSFRDEIDSDVFAFFTDVMGANIPPLTPHTEWIIPRSARYLEVSGPLGHNRLPRSARSTEGGRVLRI